MSIPLLKNHRALAAAIETTAGTAAASPTTIQNIYDLSIDYDIEYNERIAQGSFSRLAGVSGAQSGTIKFKLDAYGSGTAGTAPAWATTLLPAVGLKATGGSFSVSSVATDFSTLTIYAYEDGVLKKLVGAMGDLSGDATDGKFLTLSFDMKGVFVPVTDSAIIAPTFSSVIPPAFLGATFTNGSGFPPISKFSFKMNNQVTLRQDVTSSTGYISAIITDRNVGGSFDPEATTVAHYDAFGKWLAGTTAALSCQIGSSGTGLTLAMPDVQYKQIKEGDRNGISTNEIDFMATCGTTADSELTITF